MIDQYLKARRRRYWLRTSGAWLLLVAIEFILCELIILIKY
jgi:hypothetical protein